MTNNKEQFISRIGRNFKQSTINAYELRLQKLCITNYTDLWEIKFRLEKVSNLETCKQSWSAILWHIWNTVSDKAKLEKMEIMIRYIITNIYSILKDKRKENRFTSIKDEENYMKCEEIIKIRNGIIKQQKACNSDSLAKEILAILLNTYFPPRQEKGITL